MLSNIEMLKEETLDLLNFLSGIKIEKSVKSEVESNENLPKKFKNY